MKRLNLNNGNALLGFVIVVLLLSASGWAACTSAGEYHDFQWTYCNRYANCPNACTNFCSAPKPVVPDGYVITGSCEYRTSTNTPLCGRFTGTTSDCSEGTDSWGRQIACDGYVHCDTKCEADSIACELAGDVWQTDQSASCGKSCKVNHCNVADSTWLSTSIAACTGSNNYAIVNTDSTCEHVGTCCSNDSIPSGNTCKWRCDSVLTTCGNRTGELFGGVLPDTSISGQDTTFSYQCYYNCSHSPNPDSTVYLVEGNIVLSGPSDSIADGIKSEWFSSIRSTTGSIYVYDYLSPAASEYVDSIAAMKCVEHLWRCVINSKYVYWYDNQEVPAGCTNIVRVK